MSDRLISDILRKDRQELRSKRFRENCLIIGAIVLFFAGMIWTFGAHW